MLRQGLQQKLLQKLSPQQIQFIKLLQIPTAALEARIKQELEENPALMEGQLAPTSPYDEPTGEADTPEADSYENEGLQDAEEQGPQEISLDEYIDQEDYAYKTKLEDDPNDDRYEAPIVQRNSLYDRLMGQIGLFDLTDTQTLIATQIIGSVDEDGYFRRPLSAIVDDLAFRQGAYVPEEEVEKVLWSVQQLDPPGIGARDLQECLMLQLDRKPASPERDLAQQIVMDYFEEFTKKHFDKIIERMGIDREVFREAYNLITRLNPKPGEDNADGQNQYIIPDFILTAENGELQIKLNRRNAPELNISPDYLDMLRQYEKMSRADSREARETTQFVKNRIDAAKWFIDAIRQRQFTLLRTMGCIAQKQREFFLNEGDPAALRPMILKDIAEEIGMDISTISRVANAKYVQTDFGVFQLKYFFSEGITTDSGEEVSNKEVKKILKEYIDAEKKNKPLSDDKLALLLQEHGYNIARRTVAKYREQMNIPVARLRKEL